MIYATQFDAETGEAQPSSETGFESLADVIDALGDPDSDRRPAMVIYGTERDRVMYTRFKHTY